MDFGLETPPTFEELGGVTNNLLQVNVLTEREIKSETDASEANLRQSVKNDNLIPAIGARPGVNSDNFTSRISNVVDEVTVLCLSRSPSLSVWLNLLSPLVNDFLSFQSNHEVVRSATSASPNLITQRCFGS